LRMHPAPLEDEPAGDPRGAGPGAQVAKPTDSSRKRRLAGVPIERLTLLLALLVGVGGGFFAVFFRWMIGVFQSLFFGVVASRGPLLTILTPALGGLLVGPLIYFLAREAKGHGVPEVMEAVALRAGRIRSRVVLVKSIASALSIGSGGSVGREGPIVQTGSALGSTIGQFFRLSDRRIRLLVGCGAAAGIAATFNAPVAGVIFALELILKEFTATAFYHVVIASVAASVVGRAAFGNVPAFQVPEYSLIDPMELALYALLGVIAAVLARVFIRVLYGCEDLADRVGSVPEWVKPAAGGLIIGAIGLSRPEVFGVGYEAIEGALLGSMPLALMAGLVVLKIAATSITVGSGGSGGVFAPSLFIGAMLGGTFGQIVHEAFPLSTAVAGAYALVGMGALFAGTSQAPITAVLIIFELTYDYRIILPLMVACVISTAVARALSGDTIYTLKLRRRGVDLRGGRDVGILERLTVAEALSGRLDTVRVGMTLREVVSLMQETRHNGFPVVDDAGRLKGVVTLSDIRRTPMPGRLDRRVEEVMSPDPIAVTPGDSLAEAMHKMTENDLGRLPVVSPEDPSRPVGILTRSNVIRAYDRALVRLNGR